jgi:hypothetical protein
MSDAFRFIVPDEVELLEFFGCEPVEKRPGFAMYKVSDDRGVELRFSYDLYQRSVETVVSVASELAAKVTHEMAGRMIIRDGRLLCELIADGAATTLVVDVSPRVRVVWTTLGTE